MNWEKEFDKIYPLQVWNEGNKEQAIFITPILQSSHKEKIKGFIKELLVAKDKECQQHCRKVKKLTAETNYRLGKERIKRIVDDKFDKLMENPGEEDQIALDAFEEVLLKINKII